jgi:hypothetical protein
MSLLDDWRQLPSRVDAIAAGDPEAQANGGMTRRQLVHHLVEAHVVAASVVIAALGAPGSVYDWSWMQPFGPWLGRLAYDKQPIEPALALMRALNVWVANVVEAAPPGGNTQQRDAPDAELRRMSIEDLLRQEIEHVHGHTT